MKILTTGRGGKAGSWAVRGMQLGGANGTVQHMAGVDTIYDHDVVVVVKRIPPLLLKNIRYARRPWIWDLVDFYPQPECGKWSRDQAIDWVHQQIQHHQPDGIIYPTQRMMDDIGLPGIVVYHHHRPWMHRRAVAPKIQLVGYDGRRDYLGRWQTALMRHSAAIGARFMDKGITDAFDVVVGLRDEPFHGYVQQHWKSNVKLANAHGAGIPFIGQPDSGYTETQAGGEVWVERYMDLLPALEQLRDPELRADISKRFYKNRITVKQCAEQIAKYARLFIPRGA